MWLRPHIRKYTKFGAAQSELNAFFKLQVLQDTAAARKRSSWPPPSKGLELLDADAQPAQTLRAVDVEEKFWPTA